MFQKLRSLDLVDLSKERSINVSDENHFNHPEMLRLQKPTSLQSSGAIDGRALRQLVYVIDLSILTALTLNNLPDRHEILQRLEEEFRAKQSYDQPARNKSISVLLYSLKKPIDVRYRFMLPLVRNLCYLKSLTIRQIGTVWPSHEERSLASHLSNWMFYRFRVKYLIKHSHKALENLVIEHGPRAESLSMIYGCSF